MSITGFYLMLEGVKIYCETNGGPEDETIICLHTAGRDSRQYHEMMILFANKYRMIAFDMPAHGKSWPLAGNQVVDHYLDYGQWIWRVIQALAIKNPIIIGCSMGGNIVYHMAITYPVKAIVSMQGSDYTPTITPEILELLDHPYVSCQHSHLEFTESLIGQATSQERKAFILWGVNTEIGKTKKGDLTLYNGFDLRDQMALITCPVLVIHGTDDQIVTTEIVEATISRITNSKHLVYKPIEHYGHFIIVEAPETVCSTIEAFITTIEQLENVS